MNSKIKSDGTFPVDNTTDNGLLYSKDVGKIILSPAPLIEQLLDGLTWRDCRQLRFRHVPNISTCKHGVNNEIIILLSSVDIT